MATKKTFSIFTEAIGLYFSNLDKFLKYMTFPVLGQIAGLVVIFFTTYIYTQNLPKLIEKYPNLDNFNSLILLSIIITLPGLAIFVKAFWEYIVAYGAINSMYQNMSKSGRVYDFEAHTQLIKRRTPAFVALWLILGIFTLLAILPPFWIICGIFAVYFILVFQVFTFEPNISAFGCFKESLILIKGRFAKTFLLLCLIGGLTYVIIPQICLKAMSLAGISNFISNLLIPFVNILPQFDLEQYGLNHITNYDIALLIVETTFAQILIQYTLPLRSIMWSLWYKEGVNGGVNGGVNYKRSETTSKSKKRPSEKLMESSRKKYSTNSLNFFYSLSRI